MKNKEVKYYVKAKFYLKGGVVIEKTKEKCYDNLDDAKYERSMVKNVINNFVSSDKESVLNFDGRVIFHRKEFIAAEIDIVKE